VIEVLAPHTVPTATASTTSSRRSSSPGKRRKRRSAPPTTIAIARTRRMPTPASASHLPKRPCRPSASRTRGRAATLRAMSSHPRRSCRCGASTTRQPALTSSATLALPVRPNIARILSRAGRLVSVHPSPIAVRYRPAPRKASSSSTRRSEAAPRDQPCRLRLGRIRRTMRRALTSTQDQSAPVQPATHQVIHLMCSPLARARVRVGGCRPSAPWRPQVPNHGDTGRVCRRVRYHPRDITYEVAQRVASRR
jgi:hypothetical protein